MADIIIIEPDLVLANTYRQFLVNEGHRVTLCAGAQSGILAADNQKPDIVLLELQLVGHSGIEFLYEFRSYPEWQDIPVIIHSNVPRREFAGSWLLLKDELGVADYLYKPRTTLKEVLNRISERIPLST